MEPLELHFALSGTIFTTSRVTEKSCLTDYLHALLAERAWGRPEGSSDWVWNGEPPSYKCADEEAISYMQVLRVWSL